MDPRVMGAGSQNPSESEEGGASIDFALLVAVLFAAVQALCQVLVRFFEGLAEQKLW